MATALTHRISLDFGKLRTPWAARDLAKLRTDVASIPPRLVLGSALVLHGMEKLKPEGRQQTSHFLEQLGFKPGRFWGLLTGWAEVLSGVSFVLGVGTRLAALGALATQAVAIVKVHAPKGYWNRAQGYEYNLALVGMALRLLIAGPGRVSVHEWLEHRIEGHGARRLLLKARPTPGLRVVRLLK